MSDDQTIKDHRRMTDDEIMEDRLKRRLTVQPESHNCVALHLQGRVVMVYADGGNLNICFEPDDFKVEKLDEKVIALKAMPKKKVG